jgi:anti-anti-sigma regulatory factor
MTALCCLAGDSHMANEAELIDVLRRALTHDHQLVIDLRACTLCGSSCIRCLVRAAQLGLSIRIVHVPDVLRRAFEAVRLADHPNITVE